MANTDAARQTYLTTREACRALGYSRPDSFLRAWRARGLPLYQRPGGHFLLNREDVSCFVRLVKVREHRSGNT